MHGLAADVRLLGDLVRRDRQGPQPAGSARLAKPGEHRRRPLPSGHRLVGRAKLLPAHPALQPIADLLGCSRPGAHERQQALRGALRAARASERDEAPADGGVRQRNVRLHRDGNPQAVEDLSVEGPARLRMTKDDRDVVWLNSVGEQARDLAPDCLRLAPLSRTLQ